MTERKRTSEWKRGFTLAEMLVTVLILIITLLLGAFAYTQWVLASQFRHNNTVADTMFSVLQSELSERRSANRLEEVEASFTCNNSGATVFKDYAIVAPSGTVGIDYVNIYSGYDPEGTNAVGPERGPIYSVIGTKKEWEAYCENPSSITKPALRMVYDMLSEYMFAGDVDLLDGDICVELDPAEGLVYSVFFTQQAGDEGLSYTGTNPNLLDRRITQRRMNLRNDHRHDLVGYSGVEQLSISTSKITTKPVVQNLMLNNEETLNLTFNLNPDLATKLMSYSITLYDADGNKKLATIEMNNLNIDGALDPSIYNLNGIANAIVDCKVTRYDGDTKQEEMMSFPAWVDDNGKIKLILDAVDYKTSAEKLQEAYGSYVSNSNGRLFCDALKNTFSIYRLGIQNTDNLYCTVYAEGGGFSTTATKTSNTANRAFATSNAKTHDYGIANARHLYNLRFEESAKAANNDTYANTFTLRNDVNMNTIQVFSNYEKPSDTTATLNALPSNRNKSMLLSQANAQYFPSFETLGKGSVLESSGNNPYTIRNLKISKANNIATLGFAPNSANDTNGTGLFLVNSGTIRNVTLNNVSVNGKTVMNSFASERTGSFCGTNAGQLTALKTTGNSAVEGIDYVGGIFGYYDETLAQANGYNTKNTKITNLSNEATVTGSHYVGGIVGLLSGERTGDTTTLTVDNCKNFGAIYAANEEDAYIGGIVGLADSVDITNCISNPQNDATVKNGYFVGGIAGLAYNCVIEDSGTSLQAGYTGGTISGNRYVGGVVGLNISSHLGSSKGTTCVNEISVAGNSYVGGIAGSNAKVEVLTQDVTVGKTEFEGLQGQTIDSFIQANGKTWYEKLDARKVSAISEAADTDDSIEIRNWVNKGVVTASDYYSGGITGFNTGRVIDCTTTVYQGVGDVKTCSYAGGIAGYNNGTLNTSNENSVLSVECYVTGKDFVGGVVGYNDVNATVYNYKVTGGKVYGSGTFTGGYAGFNASVNLLQKEDGTPLFIEANLNRVEGNVAVGGVIGGNVVPVGSGDTVKATFNVNNFLGSIEGATAVGGYVGYNAVPANSDAKVGDTLRERANTVCQEIGGKTNAEVLATLDTLVEGWGVNNKGLIIGPVDDSKMIVAYTSSIKGEVAVGGVIGYGNRFTALTINNVENKIPVTATKSISYDELNQLLEDGRGYPIPASGVYTDNSQRYSLVGGIIGIVNSNTVLNNCYNADIGDVNGVGTYLGGLTEVNLGRIQNCKVASIGNTGHTSVGGLAGVNIGTITGTVPSTSTVTGLKYTGGIASENYGEINLNKSMLKGNLTVNAKGEATGGVVGYNGTGGKITMAEYVKITVDSTSKTVGGMIGINDGGTIVAIGDNGTFNGSVSGTDMVGGIVGLQKSGDLSRLTNNASVTSTGANGNAAGIVGEIGNGSVKYCVNTGTVVSSTGNAAGIVGVNRNEVLECTNYGPITAPGGNAGGICVENFGRIQQCAIQTKTDDNVIIKGLLNAGGITALNKGEVIGNTLDHAEITNYPDSDATSTVGGIAGTNYSTIDLSAQNLMSNVSILTNANASALGGIAGLNTGTIQNGTLKGYELVQVGAGTATEYKTYSYIETQQGTSNANGSYFDLGYVPTVNTEVVFDGMVVSGDTALFGVRKASGDRQFAIQFDSNKVYSGRMGNQSPRVSNISMNTRATFTLNRQMLTVASNGALLAQTSFTGIPTLLENQSIYAGAINTNGKAGNIGNVRIYSIKIYENGQLVREYLPAENKAGKIGLLETQSLTFIQASSQPTSSNYSAKVDPNETPKTYYTGSTTKTVTNMVLKAANGVSYASIGNIAGINDSGATITGVEVENGNWDSSLTKLLGNANCGYGGIAGLNRGTISDSGFSGTMNVAGETAAIVNVGGITGKNESTGVIENSTVGLSGNVNLSTSGYGYLGGITGWNYGSIVACDNRSEKDKTGEESADEGYSVMILNAKGHTGGIVGYEAAGSLLSSSKDAPITTGSNWSVTCATYANDNGTGGIIGYSESGNRNESYAYIQNFANVTMNPPGVSESMAVGGIVGRHQNNENANLIFEYCENRGTLTAVLNTGSMTGGMIGRLKYYGVTMDHCVNYGAITSNIAGGIMGDGYDCTSNSTFTRCVNFGTITGNRTAGGILGKNYENSPNTVQVEIINCINVGTINGVNNDSTGGIQGSNTGQQTLFVRCRNYGTINGGSSGIAPYGKQIKDCFDFRSTGSILSTGTNKNNLIDSYFFSPKLMDNSETTALQAWISSGKNLKDSASETVKSAFAKRFALESGKVGLPAVSYMDANGNLQITSYRVYDVNSNPLAGIGISNYDIPRVASGLEELTSDAMHNYNELEVETYGFTSDGLIEQYYRDKYPTLADTAVLNLKLTQTGAIVKATWNELSGAYAYKLRYRIVNPDGTVVGYYVTSEVYGTTSSISVPAEWSGCTIEAEVRAVNGEEDAWVASESMDAYDESEADTENNWSNAELVLSEILPTPTVVLELGAMKANGSEAASYEYTAVLTNTAAFDKYLEALRNAGVANPVVVITVDNTEGNSGKYTIKYDGTPMSAHSVASSKFGTNNANVTIRAAAKCTYTQDGETVTATSQSSSQQCAVYNEFYLGNNKMVVTTFNGFTGTLPNELEYRITNVAQPGSVFLYQTTELMMNESLSDDVRVEMAVSSNTSVIQKDNKTQTITLTNLPENLLEGEDPTVSSQTFSIRTYPWYGQNRAIYYGHEVAQSITDVDALLALTDPNRADETIFDGTTLKQGYVIYRNVTEDGSLSYDVRYNAMLADETTYGKNVNECTYTYDTSVRNDKNQIQVNATVDSYDTQDKVARTTDTIQPYAMNIERVLEGQENEYLFTWNDSLNGEVDKNAQYVLQLYGVDVNDSTKTHALLAESGKLSIDANGTWQYKFTDTENKWNYGELYVRVIKVGNSNGTYTEVWPYYMEQRFTHKQRFTTITAPTVTVPEDAGTMDYGLSWTAVPEEELNSGELLTYEVTIKDVTEDIDEADRKPDTVLYAAVVDGKTVLVSEKPTSPQVLPSTNASLTMDAYDNCNIAVSIQAIAVADSTTYRDGAEGTPRTLMLTTRLPKPDITKLTMTPSFAEDDSVERTAIIESGLTLVASVDDRYSEVNGQYELKLVVGDHEIVLTNRMLTGLLNAGDSTYHIPNELTDSEGEVVKLSDYAGTVVKAQLRAFADSHISSYWSEEGEYRIPRMNLAAPELSINAENTQSYTQYPVYVVEKNNGTVSELTAKVNVKQETVTWEDDPTDGGYIVRMTASTESIDDIPQRTAYEFVFTRNADGALEYNGVVIGDDTVLDGYTVKTSSTFENNEIYSSTFTEISAMVRVEDGKVILSLPDNSELDTSVAPLNTTGSWTQNVTVSAMKPIDSEYYLDSKNAYLSKTVVDNNSVWNQTSAVYESTLPTCDATGTYDSDANTITVQSAENVRVMIEVTVDGNAKIYAMVASPSGLNTLDLSVLPEGWQTINALRFRYILTAEAEMVTDWSESQEVTITAPIESQEP